MKIGELNGDCSKCTIVDYCADCICNFEVLKNIDVEDYIRLAKSITVGEIQEKLRQYEELEELITSSDWNKSAISDIVAEKYYNMED